VVIGFMRLSKNEAKYRKKFIAEHNYNKVEQMMFDKEISSSPFSYKVVYECVKKGIYFSFMAGLSMHKLIRHMDAMRTQANKLSNSFNNLWKELSDSNSEEDKI
jgi:hypothetical protein